MKARLLLLGAVLVIILAGCSGLILGGPSGSGQASEEDQAEEEEQTTDDGDESTAQPPDELRLDVKVYTFDEITPDGTVTLRATYTASGDVAEQEMTEADSGISGVTLWEGWVDMSPLSGDEMVQLSFSNSSGSAALGLGRRENPFWRTANLTYGAPYRVVDADAQVFEYVEAIRHWAGDTNGRTIPVSGSVVKEDSTELTDYTVELGRWHEIKENHTYGYVDPLVEDATTGSFSTSATDIYTHSADGDLPLEDRISLYVVKDFYHQASTGWNYQELHSISQIDEGTVTLEANRFVDFTYVFSETGQFDATDTTATGTANTVPAYDYAGYSCCSEDITDYFHSTFSDSRLDARLNRYHLGPNELLSLSFNHWTDSGEIEYSIGLSPYGSNARIAVISGDVPQTIDLAARTDWSYYVEMRQSDRPVLALKSEDGYALLRIDDVRVMTTTEMDTMSSEYEQSAAATSTSGTRPSRRVVVP